MADFRWAGKIPASTLFHLACLTLCITKDVMCILLKFLITFFHFIIYILNSMGNNAKMQNYGNFWKIFVAVNILLHLSWSRNMWPTSLIKILRAANLKRDIVVCQVFALSQGKNKGLVRLEKIDLQKQATDIYLFRII
jgi:hypothetical protein